MQTCSEVMTLDPVYCTPGDTIVTAAQRMKAEAVGSLPVIQDESTMKPVGIITDRNIALGIVAEGRDGGSTLVEELMTRHPITCRAYDDLEKAITAMEYYRVRRIPVVDENDHLVGIIAQVDIAEYAESQWITAEIIVA